MTYNATWSLTSVVDIVNNVKVVLHRGAVRAAEAGGEEEEQRQSCGQPAARQDAVAVISRSPRQHAVEVAQGTEKRTEGRRVSNISLTVRGHLKQKRLKSRKKTEILILLKIINILKSGKTIKKSV